MYTPKYKVRMEHFFQIYVKLKLIWKVLILCNSRSLDLLQGFQKSNTMHVRRKKEKRFKKEEGRKRIFLPARVAWKLRFSCIAYLKSEKLIKRISKVSIRNGLY